MTMERKFWKLTRWARAGRFWLFLILAAIASVASMGEASAQDFATCYSVSAGNATCPTRQVAREQAIAHAATKCAALPSNNACTDPNAETEFYLGIMYRTKYCYAGGCAWGPNRTWAVECEAGEVWDDILQKCSVTCANKPPLTNKKVTGSFFACSDGCQFQQAGAVTVCLGSGTEMYCGAPSWEPTGSQCQVGDGDPQPHNPDQETCRSTGGGWSECVKPNGDHCVTGAKGTKMCWAPGEAGQRHDTANIEWADRQPEGTPTTPPSNIENPIQETTTADKGGVSGSSVGGSFVIGGGSGTGQTGGQNNTGSGGSGSGDGDEGDNEHGGPGSGLGNVYESDGKTVADIFGVFRARAENAPVIDAATGFLEVSAGSGCPVFTLASTAYWDAMVFDYHCSGPLADNLALGAYLLMAIAAFIAFRIAFH